MSDVLVYPAYRRGYYVKFDLDSQWAGKFDWLVTVGGPAGLRMGWFGSLDSAYRWMYRERVNGEW